jgi:uncharacterized repeat protein (TIGR01451 family)
MRRWRLLAFMAVGVVAIGVSTATAVHDDDLFQLDYTTSPAQGAANTSSSNITPPGNIGDDWDKVYGGTSNAFATAFITDPTGAAENSFYTGGGSKDERPISTGGQHWEWDDANDVVPDKDDLSHAFAAAYRDPDDGHVIFYFGADRFDTSGDAEVGFWFFRQPVTLGTKPNFNGEHEVGDILVLANWGGSNKVGDIAVYEWVGGSNPLNLLLDTAQADCSSAPANDPVCAVVNNTAGETPPWPYTNKDSESAYRATALFEGGIDVNALLEVTDIGCFSSFLAATRSSHSTTAQLKDFALGAFPVCGIEVQKTGDTLSKVGDPADYTITIENTGQATLFKRNISDSLLGAITTNGVNQANPFVLTNTCGASLAAGATCTITARRTVQPGDPDPLPNTVSILYTEKANFTGLAFNDTDDHSVNLFQPAVTITKEGDGLSKATDPVTYTFTIRNESSADSPNLTLASINDNVIGNLSAQATAAGCDVLTTAEVCSFNLTRTVQGSDPDPLVNTVDVLYHPAGFPNDIRAADSHSVNLFQPSVSITKNGDELSKIGDQVTYHVKVTNTSSNDSPNLVLDTIVDDVLGDLSDEAPASCDSIAPGSSCEFNVPWTVAPVDVHPADGQPDDPVINTVTIHFHPAGFPNDITATASHELNLFQPSIAFSKTADTRLSKATDKVNYRLTLNNTSSPDTPDLVCTIVDAKLGVDKQVTLASGAGSITDVAYTVQANDPDPLVNTASVTCSPTGFPNVLEARDSWTVNLFQPSVRVEKGGDTLSKIGDTVTYTFTITNTSSADSPNLHLNSITDDVLGVLTAPAACDNLAPGAQCSFSVNHVIPVGAPDPLVNTVEVHYNPVGFPNDITDSDSHSVNLFRPSITFDKTGDTLSKATDDVRYTLTLGNTSTSDTPDLQCTITDAMLGPIGNVTLASGATAVFNRTYTVKASDPDPLVNTASVSCSPTGFPNVLTAEDSHSVNLFQPSLDVRKTGPAFSKAGDTATYTVTIQNTSSADSPNLVLASFSDSLAGSVTPPASCSPLAPGASCTFSYPYVVKASDADPLVNTATAHYNPAGFPNDVSDSASATADLLHPSFTVTKDCTTDPVNQGGTASFDITYRNTGDADLVFTAPADEGGPQSVAAGGTKTVTITRPVPGGATLIQNTVSGTVTLAARYGLSNTYSFEAGDSCAVKGKVTVVKTVSGQAPPAGQSFTFELRQGASTVSQGTVLETKNTDASGNIAFATQLNPGQTYQICEWVFPGWNTNLAGDGPLFVPESIIPPALPNPNVNNLVVCADFTVTSGQTRTFTVDNTPPPGGRALTIGFWKNWASCASSNGKGQKAMLDLALGIASKQTTLPPGGLVVSAQNPGAGWPNYAATWYLILRGDPTSTADNIKPAIDCAKAVNLLNKSTIDGKKKMASDPLFNMTAQLVAAQLNRFMDSGISGVTIVNIDRAVLLDGKYKFNGLTYSPALTAADTSLANCLATQLDNYNNGRPVSACP